MESKESSSSSPLPTRPVYLWYPPLPSALLDDSDDDYPTHTSREQQEVERRIEDALQYVLPKNKKKKQQQAAQRDPFGGGGFDGKQQMGQEEEEEAAPALTSCPSLCQLSFDSHASFLLNGLHGRGCHSSLDASRPWLVYWSLHGLDLMERMEQLDDRVALGLVHFLQRCMHPEGGVGGGPGQQAHTAPTYAGVLSLCILSGHPTAGQAALSLLRSSRRSLYSFLLRCKEGTDGAFRVSTDGEVDTRGAYTVLSVASLLNLLTPELTKGVGEWIARCQTYEGGLGGEPGTEAHGGYTFCGLAASVLLNSTRHLNLPLMLKWATRRQMEKEGGFQGRTNKLVDGCYSFWMGALFPLLYSLMQAENKAQARHAQAAASSSSSAVSTPIPSPSPSPLPPASSSLDEGWLFDTLALQRYLLVCCQTPMGGLRDKPGKYPDLYHTCYGLSGLTISQHANTLQNSPILGQEKNLLAPVHPVYNLRFAHVERIMQAFAEDLI